MYLNPIYVCVCIILFAGAFYLIILLQLQIIHLRNKIAHQKDCLIELINLLCDYLAEERNECQDKLNEVTGGFACTTERFRKSRKIEKLDIIYGQFKEIWQNMN